MKSVKTALLGSIAAVALTSPALAQDAPEAEPSESNEIIVIGTAGAGISRQEAAFAVTNLDAEDISRAAPTSTADLFKVIPGVWSESSGGQNGANIFVRGYPGGGDAQFVTLTTQGVPFFAPPTLSFLENTQLIRIDETIERVEAVRGGTGSLFGNGQPGLTVNFVQREGGQDFEGVVRGTIADFGDIRGDLRLSGPLGPQTTFMVGGYYNSGSGVRDPGFTVESGGQVTANIRHELDNGSVMVFARYLNDYGQWLLPIPVLQNGDEIRQFGNIDLGTGVLAGPETRLSVLPDGTRADLADGRGANLINLGANFDYGVADGVTVRYRFSYLNGDADTTGLVPASTAQSAGDFAASLGGTVGSLTFVNGGNPVTAGANQQVIRAGTWVVRKQIENFSNDLALEWESDSNKLTIGAYLSDFASDDQWNLGNIQLLTAENNGRLLNLTLADGRIATDRGFTRGSFFGVNASYDGREYALYAVDEFNVTPELRIDAGIRYQDYRARGTLENGGGVDNLDGNALTLFDNAAAGNSTFVLNGTFRTINFSNDSIAWTAGVNYEFTPSLAAYARYNRGNTNPFFDNLRDGVFIAPQVDNYEVGLKFNTDVLALYATIFRTDFEGLGSTTITNGLPEPSIGGARSTGVEVEGRLRPFGDAYLDFSGTFLDADYRDFTEVIGGVPLDRSGNQVQRQPRWQWRVTPGYDFAIDEESRVSIFGTFSYIGDRFSDVANLQRLPNYFRIDGGVSATLGNVLLSATVDNLTDEVGLTEGDPRAIGTVGEGVVNARPILGRSFRFSVGYRF